MALHKLVIGQKKSSETAKKSAKTGNTFENEIMDVCAIYKKLDKAWIQKNATPTAWVPQNKATGKGGFLIHSKKHGFDFVGAYFYSQPVSPIVLPISSGIWQPIFFEAKTTLEGRIEIQEKSGIKVHQIEELLWLETRGLKAFFLWQIRKAGEVFMFKASNILKVTDNLRKRKYIDIEDCQDFHFERIQRVDYQGKTYLDFLNYLFNLQGSLF